MGNERDLSREIGEITVRLAYVIELLHESKADRAQIRDRLQSLETARTRVLVLVAVVVMAAPPFVSYAINRLLGHGS